MTKKLYTTILCTTFALFLLLLPTRVWAQSELFGENLNKDFIAKVQPELLKIVGDAKTTPYDFMLACKRLSVYGDAKAAAVVAKSLGIPERSLSARTALQAMPFPEALAELRTGLGRVTDPVLKAGIVGSLGMRRDRDSTSLLLPLLKSDQEVLVQAAMFALARIADPAYCEAMIAMLGNTDFAKAKSRADLNLMYGEFLRLDGKGDVAHKVFLGVAAKAPRDYHQEAACFQILLHDSAQARTLAAQWLVGDDEVAFKATLRATRFVRSDAMAEILIQSYSKVSAQRKPLVLVAIGDQRNPKGQATLIAALTSNDAPIKEAAVVALKAFADRDSFKGLIAAAISGTPEMRRDSIAVIQMFDDNVNGDIIVLLKQDDAHKVLGVELIAARKISSCLTEVFTLAKSGSSAVRPAAIRALGEIATLKEFGWLIDQVVRNESVELCQAARDGLKTACGVVEDKTAAAELLAAAADKLKGRQDDRLYLYRMLALVGGSTARKAVERIATAQDRQSWDLATKVLGEWMDPDVGPILLNLANTPGYPYANRALRGYLRLARQFTMPAWMRAAMVRDALASSVCKEKEKETANLIVKQYKLDLNVPETADQKLIRSLEIQKAIYGLIDDPTKQKDVTAKVCERFLAEGKATVSFEGGYNKCFGGDPAPNVPKKMYVTVCDRNTGKVKTIIVGENRSLTLSR